MDGRGPYRLTIEQFEDAVEEALAGIPADLLGAVTNVAILVEDECQPGQPEVLGVYDGIPLPERTDAVATLPDRITLYRGPLERLCGDREELLEQIAVTVVHEIAHHFGIDDDRLRQLGWD